MSRFVEPGYRSRGTNVALKMEPLSVVEIVVVEVLVGELVKCLVVVVEVVIKDLVIKVFIDIVNPEVIVEIRQ